MKKPSSSAADSGYEVGYEHWVDWNSDGHTCNVLSPTSLSNCSWCRGVHKSISVCRGIRKSVILRWLRYTERRALLVTSVDGFVKWSWSSKPALVSGAFIRTSRGPAALPAGSAVAQEQFTPEVRAGVDHPTGVWFNKRARELTFRSEKYDTAYTLLHLRGAQPKAWDEGS